jgi:hypothetical protein
MPEGRGQRFQAEGLVQHRVHVGIAPHLGCRPDDMRRQGDDRHPAARRFGRAPADLARGLIPVHPGHAAVHQDGIELFGARGLDGFNTARDELCGDAEALQRLQRHFAVDRAVVGDEHPRSGKLRQGFPRSLCAATVLSWDGERSSRLQTPQQLNKLLPAKRLREHGLGQAVAHQLLRRRVTIPTQTDRRGDPTRQRA